MNLLKNIHDYINGKAISEEEITGYYSLGKLKTISDWELVLDINADPGDGVYDRTIWVSPCIYMKEDNSLSEIHNYWEIPYMQQKEWVDTLVSKVLTNKNFKNIEFYHEADDIIVMEAVNKEVDIQCVADELYNDFDIYLIH